MKNTYNSAQLNNKARHFCAYRERCHIEVYSKLLDWGASPTLSEEIISDLILAGFVNEERFAQHYVGSKFRQKKWGKVKIKRELQKRHISEYCIAMGMKEIEEEDYMKTLNLIIEKKNIEFRLDKPVLRNNKIGKYCIQRGFEQELVWEEIRQLR